MARTRLRDMSSDAIDSEARHVSWSDLPLAGTQESADDARPAWQSWEASACDECGAVYVGGPGEFDEGHASLVRSGRDSDREENQEDGEVLAKALDCTGHVPMVEGPQMNYFYPARFNMSCEDAARLIAAVPLCVVDLDGETGLALTGGGMDLSWEIAHAHMLLGMLPPIQRRLPRMAGRFGARERWIVSGMRASLRVKAGWVRSGLRDLRELVAWYEERATARNKAQTDGAR